MDDMVPQPSQPQDCVLIIDDHHENLRLLSELLTEAGFRTKASDDGGFALRSIDHEVPDLILLDIRMPGIDGYELCRRFKDDPRTSDVPVIFLSALDTKESKITGFEAGAVDYIAKPFQAAEVVARVNTHLALRRLHLGLEARVEERTAELKRSAENLRREAESSKRLTAILESTSDLVAIALPSGELSYMNRSGRSMLGWRSDEDIGARTIPDTHPAWALRLVMDEGIPSAIRSGVWQGETAILDPAGNEIPVSQVIMAHRNSDSELTFLSTIMRDITERQRAQEVLQESKMRAQRQRAAIAELVLNDAVHAGEIESAVLRVTETMAAAVQVARASVWLLSEDARELRCIDEYHAEGGAHHAGEVMPLDLVPEYWQALLEHGSICAEDAERDPSLKGIHATRFAPQQISSVLDVSILVEKSAVGVLCLHHVGRPRGWFSDEQAFANTAATLVSQTLINAERRRTELELHQERERLDLAQDAAGIGMYDWDLTRNEAFFDQRFLRLLGLDPALGKTSRQAWLKAVLPEDRDRVLAEERRCLESGDALVTEYRVRKPDGSILWVDNRARTVPDEEGHPHRMIGTIADITARKNAEQERETILSRLAQSQKMEAIGLLAGGVAHDFNNQLQAVFSATEILDDLKLPGDRVQDLIQIISTSAKHAGTLTKQLLTYARRAPMAFRKLDLYEVETDAFTILTHTLPPSIRLSHTHESEAPVILGDSSLLVNVLVNLGINARDAMPEGGELRFCVSDVVLDPLEDPRFHDAELEAGEYVSLKVTDDGVGMDEEVVSRAFEPFFTTKELGTGTGMGLATAFGTIKAHNGSIRLESALGEGTTVEILLPRVSARSKRAEPLSEPVSGGGGPYSLLLVDDNPQICSMGSMILNSNGHQVSAFTDPHQALEFFRRNWRTLDLAVLDKAMPSLDGLTLFKAMREIDPDVKAILSSGNVMHGEGGDASIEGFAAILDKPYRASELLETVEKLMSQVPNPNPTQG